jgi:putative spermidine/putrescine transport system ATP-binding protein
MSRVEFESISKSFGSERALENLDLIVEDGTLVTLLGPSGCGKTTALRILAGFESADSGSLVVDGEDIQQAPATLRGFGMVFQAYSLFPNLTAFENIAFPLRIRKTSNQEIKKQVEQLFEVISMTNQMQKYPHQLSGGQQQRIALARALAAQPKVLLLDEPLSALDATVREQLRQEIRKLQTESGVTTIFVTHDQHEALAISDKVAVMNRGSIQQLGTPEEVYSNPVNEFVAKFVGVVNEVAVQSPGNGTWAWGKNKIQGPIGKHGRLLVRPENIELVAGKTLQVVNKTFQGAFSRVTLAGEDGEFIVDISNAEAIQLDMTQKFDIQLKNSVGLLVSDG